VDSVCPPLASGNGIPVSRERAVLAALGAPLKTSTCTASYFPCAFICNMLASFQDPAAVGPGRYVMILPARPPRIHIHIHIHKRLTQHSY
jgi:hypothetical protein